MVRLRKFRGLIKNEYIKIFKRTSTIVMLVLIILAGIGLPALIKIIDTFESGDNYSYYTPAYEIYQQEIDGGYIFEPENDYYPVSEYIRWDKAQYIIEGNLEYSIDWRYDLLDTALYGYEEYVDYSNIEEEVYAQFYIDYGLTPDAVLTEDQEIDLEARLISKYEEANVKAYKKYKETDEFKQAIGLVLNNDLNGYYECVIAILKIKKASGSELPEVIDAQIEFYTYLRDNSIIYITDTDEEYIQSIYPDIYDERFFDASELCKAKMSIAYYEADVNNISSAEYEEALNVVALNNYLTENNITENIANSVDMMTATKITFWSAFGFSASAVGFAGVLVIVIAALSVANEFSNGTIKFLLINPVKRWKILVAKYVSVLSIGYLMIFIIYIISMLTSLICFGAGSLGDSYYTVVDGKVQETLGLVYVLKDYLIRSIEVVVMSTLAFSISSLMKSASFAIGISMFGMLSGSVVVAILSTMGLDWGRYLIFANMDITAINNCATGFAFHSIETAIAVIAVHMVIFWLIAWDSFTKREI